MSVGDARAELKHRYSFDESAGSTTVTDSASGSNGTLINNTGGSQFADGQLTLGNDGSQSSTSGNGDYVDFPNGMISDLVTSGSPTQFTMEAWFTWNGSGPWQRIWDFGTSVGGEDVSNSGDNTAQFFSTPAAGGGGVRVAWRPQGSGELNLTRQPSASTGEPHHIAFVWHESTTSAKFYFDGVLVGQNNNTTMTVENDYAGFDVNNWLGRSQWPDTLFVGSYDEFRIWDNAVNPLDMARHFVGGPDDPDGGDLGDVTSLSASIGAAEMILEESTSLTVNADYEQFPGLNVTTLATLSSNNENVATVGPDGTVTAIGEGTARITAEFEGQTASVDVTVSIPPLPEAVLVHRYDFSEDPGSTTVNDLEGNAHGEAINLDFTGEGSANLNGANQAYVDLPNGIISAMDNGTVEAWTTFSPGGGNWQRVFDFGNTSLGEDPDPNGPGYTGAASWFFAPRQGSIDSNNGGRYAFDPGPGGENPQINPGAEGAAPVGEEFHTVAIFNHAQRVASIWINGNKIGEAPIPADRPLSSLDDVNNWLGRSQWSGDAFSTANFNEFRIYQGVLTPLQIALNNAAGPDMFIDDPGTVQSLTVETDVTSLTAGGLPANLNLTANFENITDVNVTSVPGVAFESSDDSVARVISDPARIIPVGAGTATITASLEGMEAEPLEVTVAGPSTTPVLDHRYQLEGDATDSEGDQDGTLIGDGTFENGGVTLSGDAYVDLPDFLFSDYYFTGETPPVTIEIYGRWDGGGSWQRFFDFGSNDLDVQGPEVGPDAYGGVDWLFLTPSSGGGQLQLSFNDGQGSGFAINGEGLAAGQDFYVAAVFDPSLRVARLYKNGVLQGIAEIPENAVLAINDVNVWLGRSNFSADPFYNGSITEFRVWNGALQEADILKHSICGPNDLDCEVPTESPAITAARAGEAITISWPEEATGFILESSPVLGPDAVWTPVSATPEVANGMRSVTLTPSEDTYFRLRTNN